MPYKAKSLEGAQTRVRQLQKQVEERDALLERYDRDRRLMAMLAAETPQFHNPLLVYEAKKIRDGLLRLPNRELTDAGPVTPASRETQSRHSVQ